jgi:hypothetical protein
MGPWFVPPLAEQDKEFHEQRIIGAQNRSEWPYFRAHIA